MDAEVFKAKFTTSASAAEEKAEERASYFGKNVRTVEGSKPPTGRHRPLTRSMKPTESSPMPYSRPGAKPVEPKPILDLSQYSPNFPAGSDAIGESIGGKVVYTGFIEHCGTQRSLKQIYWLGADFKRYMGQSVNSADPYGEHLRDKPRRRGGRG